MNEVDETNDETHNADIQKAADEKELLIADQHKHTDIEDANEATDENDLSPVYHNLDLQTRQNENTSNIFDIDFAQAPYPNITENDIDVKDSPALNIIGLETEEQLVQESGKHKKEQTQYSAADGMEGNGTIEEDNDNIEEEIFGNDSRASDDENNLISGEEAESEQKFLSSDEKRIYVPRSMSTSYPLIRERTESGVNFSSSATNPPIHKPFVTTTREVLNEVGHEDLQLKLDENELIDDRKGKDAKKNLSIRKYDVNGQSVGRKKLDQTIRKANVNPMDENSREKSVNTNSSKHSLHQRARRSTIQNYKTNGAILSKALDNIVNTVISWYKK